MPASRPTTEADRLISELWDRLVAAVQSVPERYERGGLGEATVYLTTTVRPLLDRLALAMPPTEQIARARHDIHRLLTVFGPVLMERTAIGAAFRHSILLFAEREFLSPSIPRAVSGDSKRPDGWSPPELGEE